MEFQLASQKKEVEENTNKTNVSGHLATFWFNTVTMLFVPLGVLLVMKDEWYVAIKAYKFVLLLTF